jgi:hypothetical protein
MGRAVRVSMTFGSKWYVTLWYEVPDHEFNRMHNGANLITLLANK